MTVDDVARSIKAVLALALPEQAVCLRLAAETNIAVWKDWCLHRQLQDHADDLLFIFDQWLNRTASNDDLHNAGLRLYAALPQDLSAEPDVAGGQAGWALFDITMIALDECDDVHDDIFQTALCFAAAASCRTGLGTSGGRLDRLTECELLFLTSWWRKCCKRFPRLVSSVPNQVSN